MNEPEDHKALNGVSFVLHAAVSKNQPNQKAFIFDVGNESQNRISLFVTGQRGYLEILDRHGQSYISDWDVEFDKPLHIKMEISNEPDIGFFLLTINNEEIDLRLRSQGIEIEPDLYSFVMGGDLSGNNCAKFKMISHQFIGQTLEVTDRIEYYHYFLKCVSKSEKCIEYDGTKYLRRRSDGHLAQENGDKRPVVSDSFSSYF